MTNQKNLIEGNLFIDLVPIPVWVKKHYLMNLKSGFGEYVLGTLQSVWSYKGSMPTFTVLLDDGTMFSYLPASAFTYKGGVACSEGVDAFYSCNVFAPSTYFVKYEMPCLSSKDYRLHVFGPDRVYVGVGHYFFSLEWPEENEQVHLCEVNGQFYFVPNHKLLVLPVAEAVHPLPSEWLKLRSEWTKEAQQIDSSHKRHV